MTVSIHKTLMCEWHDNLSCMGSVRLNVHFTHCLLNPVWRQWTAKMKIFHLMTSPCPSLPQSNNAIRSGCLTNKQSVIVGCRKVFPHHLSEDGGSFSVGLSCTTPCPRQGQTAGKGCAPRPALRDALRLMVMLSLTASSRGLSLINAECVTRPALHMGWWGTACQVFLNVQEGMLQARSQLAGPHAWAPTQAETAAAFHSLCLLLTIRLPLEHFCPGQMPSGIMRQFVPASFSHLRLGCLEGSCFLSLHWGTSGGRLFCNLVSIWWISFWTCTFSVAKVRWDNSHHGYSKA